jgi:antirestriction protein ArdC
MTRSLNAPPAANEDCAHTPAISARRDIAQGITGKILAELEKGVVPWRKPWDGARVARLPMRVSGEFYRGVNIVLLWSAAAAKGFASPYWLTFNQAGKLGAHVRKGERGAIVVYYGRGRKKASPNDDDEREEEFRFLKSYVVFNTDQIDHLPHNFKDATPAAPPTPIAAHEAWFERLGVMRILTRDTACYMPARDLIGMPPISAFESAEAYAATLAHECCHATGAAHRLNRDFSKRFGSSAYAAEELVAEIGASILGAHFGSPPHHIHDYASYIGHWMKLLANDAHAFLNAAGKAQAAVDWLLDKSPAPSQVLSGDLK